MAALRIVKQKNTDYFLQIKIQEEKIIITLTDLKNIWQKQLSENEAVKNFKDNNPQVESSDEWIAEFVSNVIKNVNTDITIKVLESNINIIFSSNISNLQTEMNFSLQLQHSDTVYKEITLPLLMIINELQFRKKKLLSIIKAKDVEIKEFKFEGASITRRNAITEPFNAANFDSECQTTIEERAKNILENPHSVICPSLDSFYNEFSNVVANSTIKEEIVENNSVETKQKENEIKIEETAKIKKIISESDVELKRKITESLSRSKRPKKLYKI